MSKGVMLVFIGISNSTMLYQTSTFSFSKDATDWVIARYQDQFSKNFDHDLDPAQYTQEAQEEWHAGPVGQELIPFLATHGLDTNYYGISAFISNSDKPFIGNPHIDTRFDADGNPSEIKSRFNVLVQGNPDDRMVWWHNWTYWDPRLNPTSFELNGKTFRHKALPGSSPKERWEWLEKPDFEATGLAPSAFVRTNCAHTVSVSPGPRLVVTVALDKTLNEIFGP
jgi:hypothetical protein